ncbi:DUF262 domain-containing protein [Skermanella mucosa]|uniref:GmrSD restriction endonuclease domain-containing protein n=1 Tax=Skermanella mucosa TaxID=1789672 RepID=UPI00192BBB61|nr:DUF262 domain-containing protein [Skermanella mucosa]UEM18502.1 DUF262 domain-containing protein [Skermanella mucosa]
MPGIFTTHPIFLSQLLDGLRSGRIQLPDFQRGWVWDDDRIKGVLASVSRDFPVGAVMMLQTGGKLRFEPRPVEGVKEPACKDPEQLILDGQQRLTSLFQATIFGAPAATVNAKKQRIERWYYFDIEKSVASPELREEAVESLPPSRKRELITGKVELDLSTRELEYENLMFPCSSLFNAFEWQNGFLAYWKYDPQKTELFAKFQAEVIQRFMQYQIPVITLTDQVSKEAVCHVFEKVNTGGVTLTAFELLTASFAADAQGFRLRDDWLGPAGKGDGIRKTLGVHPALKKHRVLEKTASTDFLQAVALYHTYRKRLDAAANGVKDEHLPSVSCTRATILNLTLDNYLSARKPALDGLLAAGKFIRELRIFRSEDLPYQSQLVPLSIILACLGPDWEGHGIKQKLRRWYWCGVLGELYGGAIETRFARDVPEVLAWIKGGPEPRTVTDAAFNPTRLLTLRTRGSAAYKGVYALLMEKGGLDFRTGNPINIQVFEEEAIDIHHIFPKKWCAGNAVDAREMDCIVNKTAISARTNRMIGGKAPSAYLPGLEKKFQIGPEKLKSFLETHVIAPELLRQDDFQGFFAARSKALLDIIAEAMGKEVQVTAELPSGQEAMIEDDESNAADLDDELEEQAAA